MICGGADKDDTGSGTSCATALKTAQRGGAKETLHTIEMKNKHVEQQAIVTRQGNNTQVPTYKSETRAQSNIESSTCCFVYRPRPLEQEMC
jgi:hypothetical protein